MHRMFTGRLHVAGSASPVCNPLELRHAHAAVTEAVRTLLRQGGSVVMAIVPEPRLGDDADDLSLVFDWTVLQAVREVLDAGEADPMTGRGPIAIAVGSDSGFSAIPTPRRELWEHLLRIDTALDVRKLPPGWTAGGELRREVSRHGDAIITISGAQGVEHLATEFRRWNRPVVPLLYRLGMDEGRGGQRLAALAASDPERFFELRSGEHGATALLLLDPTSFAEGEPLGREVVRILDGMSSPTAFFVRLLDPGSGDFSDVESHFGDVVAPVVEEFGYRTIQSGSGRMGSSLMDVEIFRQLGRAAVSVVDLTGLRPNCFLELGYSLGRGTPTIVMARTGTALPFDVHSVPCYFWDPAAPIAERIRELREFWEANIARPALGPTPPRLW
jgi:hypothetical protein